MMTKLFPKTFSGTGKRHFHPSDLHQRCEKNMISCRVPQGFFTHSADEVKPGVNLMAQI